LGFRGAATRFMKKTLTALACFTLLGCGGSGASSDNVGGSIASIESGGRSEFSEFAQCSADDMKAWVQHNMDDYYLFYDQVPVVDASQYEGAEDYIRALRVAPYDRYSYVTDETTNVSFFEEGERFGFGMRIERADNQRLFFSLVEPLSPLGATDAERGDELLAINGVTPDGFTSEFIAAALGEGDDVVDVRFTLQKPNSSAPYDVTVTKSTYDVQTVLDAKVLNHNNHQVGYLNFLSFLETSEQELNDAFTEFKENDIDELVLDLRFNGGGRISIAEQIGSLIAGESVNSTTFTDFRFNDKYANQDARYPFAARSGALNLPRVYVLTSANTCSASELVINSLRPFIDVVTIGDSTCGKPYGTTSHNYCGKSMNALEVEFRNAANVGGYYDGLAADCPMTENLAQTLGQPSENLLGAALHHLDTAQCASPATTLAASDSAPLQNRTSANTSKAQEIVPVRAEERPELLDQRYSEIRTLLIE